MGEIARGLTRLGYKSIVSPWLDTQDSETWHTNARDFIAQASRNPAGRLLLERYAYNDPILETTVAGIHFKNPVLVGAGWDKVGEAAEGLTLMGFGGVEIGTITVEPQKGNPKPRQFVTGHGTVSINRLGFNNYGMEASARVLEQYRRREFPIGISVGPNKELVTPERQGEVPDADATIVDRLFDYGDYFAINVSSPNTPGLRGLQNRESLEAIISAVQKVMKKDGRKPKPLFVKIAPDLEDDAIVELVRLAGEMRIAGIIATNTSVDPRIKGKYPISDRHRREIDASRPDQQPLSENATWADEMGGLSGNDADFQRRSTDVIKLIRRTANEERLKLTIIGVGGIHDAASAIEKIRAGADLVQVVTAIRSEGPSVAGDINGGIARYMRANGFDKIEDMVGIDVK